MLYIGIRKTVCYCSCYSGTSGQGRELRAKTLCTFFLAEVVFTFDSIYGKVTFSIRVGTRRYVYRHLVCYWADLN